MVDDLKPRYTTKRLRQEIERARENDARHIAALEAQLANVKERAKYAASMCEAGYPVSAFNLATSTLSALEAAPPAPPGWSRETEDDGSEYLNPPNGWLKTELTTQPAPKDPWPVHYANTTAPGRFAPPAPKVTECATEGCEQTATVRFERGGVGSDYCHDCYMRIQALTAAQEAGKP